MIVAENGDIIIEPLNGAVGERQLVGTIGTSLGGSRGSLVKSLMDTCVWQAAECQKPTRQQFYLKVF